MAETKVEPEVGSVYVDYQGNVYRRLSPPYLAYFGWAKHSVGSEVESTVVKVLPEGAALVWSPSRGRA